MKLETFKLNSVIFSSYYEKSNKMKRKLSLKEVTEESSVIERKFHDSEVEIFSLLR